MGNIIGGRRNAKVMKINGEIFKLKTPILALDVVKDYPGHVLLDLKSVKQFGIRAKPLEPHQDLKPNQIYFLIELPKFQDEPGTRRVRSGLCMSAKDQLECLMLSRRSVSDLSIMRPTSTLLPGGPEPSSGPFQVKMRLPKAQVVKLMEECKDEAEVGEMIIGLYIQNLPLPDRDEALLCREVSQGNPGLGSITESSYKAHEVSFHNNIVPNFN